MTYGKSHLNMKNTLLHFILVFFINILFVGNSIAQEWKRELYFRNISTEDGLSNPTINCIHEDRKGFIWIGTADGLNRYDGYEFKVYQPNPADPNSIPSDRINVLYEDSDYNLWIGTPEGLCRFNYKSGKFENYKSGDGFNEVFDIAHDKKNNRIWIVSSQGRLKYLDLKSGIVEAFEDDLLTTGIVYKILNINNELYIGTSENGLYKLDLDSFVIEEFCNTKTGRFQIPSNWVTALHHYNNELLIGTEGGLIKYRFKDERIVYYNPQNSTMPSTFVSSITHNSNGEIFIGTNNGMAILNNRTELVSLHRKEAGNLTSLSSNIIRTLFVDKKDDLWVGTIQRGINYMNKESRNMTLVKKKYTNNNSLSDNNLSCFAQDNKGGMWIGTQVNGLNYYNNGKYKFFKADGLKYSLSDNSVTDICIDKKEIVWVSTYYGGLNAFKNGKFVHYMMDESDPNAIQSNKIRKIDIDQKGNLWLATMQGLESFDIENKFFKHHFLDSGNKILAKRKNIRTLLLHSDGNVYAGTNVGLYIYYPNSGKSEYFHKDPNDINSLGHNIIIDIIEDSKKRIWLGSFGGGLIRFDRKSKTFKSYTYLDGFPDNSVKNIEEDDNGDLWLGTNKGIVKFSPSTEQVVIFGKSYGLQNNVFNINASIKCNDGRLIFGGVQGFNVFTPEELELEKSPLNVVITDLKLFEKSVSVFGEHDILSKDIGFVHSLKLPYEQSKHFSISFTAQQFSNPKHIQYKYMLEGFEDEWKYIGNEQNVSFTNLKPKEYVFKVMASDNGVWNNRVRELEIRIPSPWYLTIWFKTGLVIFVIVLIVAFYFYKVHMHKERQRILEQLVNEKNYEINRQNEEITSQNEELISSNEELFAQHEEVIKQKEYIDNQNKELTKTHRELKEANSTLEERIMVRTMELKKSNIKLNKTVMDLDQFVYSASHDLSAPLKSILGLVNIAKLESTEKNLEVHLNYIEQSIKKQEKVIKSLIQYSRNSRQSIRVRQLKLSDLVDQIIAELRYMPGAEYVEIFNEVPVNTIINNDEQRILTILNNLLTNGINYRSNETVKSFIKIQFIAKESSWKLIVKDNGLGIAEDHQKKVFEMFHRANEDSEGSGLGLFIVKEAVDRLGGKISLDSSLGVGTEFVLDFPKKVKLFEPLAF